MPNTLHGLKALVTSGPTQEPLDPIRYLTNHSSGKQGHAIATALAAHGAEVTLISGPVHIPDPKNTHVIHVIEAKQMLEACLSVLEQQIDVVVCAAAVSDWRFRDTFPQKLKKQPDTGHLTLSLVKNPDILHAIATHTTLRPWLVIGFAAETEEVITHAQAKLVSKQCDWILANDVSQSVFNADNNTLQLIKEDSVETWPTMTKAAVAEKLAQEIAKAFGR